MASTEPKSFAPKDPPKLDPPKDDPISLENLAKCDGMGSSYPMDSIPIHSILKGFDIGSEIPC